jgi:hypothetical protein
MSVDSYWDDPYVVLSARRYTSSGLSRPQRKIITVHWRHGVRSFMVNVVCFIESFKFQGTALCRLTSTGERCSTYARSIFVYQGACG